MLACLAAEKAVGASAKASSSGSFDLSRFNDHASHSHYFPTPSPALYAGHIGYSALSIMFSLTSLSVRSLKEVRESYSVT